ncbi:sulfatase family protein [Botrimarina hoheduenensis]|uniref:Choline-sulfatase n=1 Tax=Botrimarina hoheduenensis TaxID=2528000 RepID=A0A5C5VYZ5_9BACT|nr:sulfatase [Botrimarina hoheduenensis]TWT43265.1 Choline-sulfatase [Botrimarina hoheduenensis]
MKARFRLVFLLGLGLLGTDFLRAAPPPNILWLTCEDLSPRLGCYGDEVARTPRIDRLATQGVRYTHAFTATGVCAPCRHTLITGLYPVQSGAQYMRTGSRSSALAEIADPVLRRKALARPLYEATPPAGVRCFTEYLRAGGYYCTNNAKEDYQFQAPVTAWDDSSRKAHYRNRRAGQPFFAVFNAEVTHESGVHGKGRSARVTDRAAVRVPPYLPDTPIVREDIARHYDNIAALDRWVGEKLDELEQAGLAETTLVFFFSDHGDGLPRHKRWVYDSGTHVPLIVRWPDGADAGTTNQRMMSFVDLAPTVLALANLQRPEYLVGRVFAGRRAEPAPAHVFMHRDRMDDTSHDTIRAVRDERFQYVRNYQPERPYLQPLSYRDRAATMGEIYRMRDAGALTAAQWQWADSTKPRDELYDTQADPDEVVNLAGDPAYRDKQHDLSVALDAWIERTGDPLATDEIEVLRTRVWPPKGEQPTTAAPQVVIDPMTHRVEITCATPGASLGYRTRSDGSWMVYTVPFVWQTAPPLEFVAHRIGWKPTKIARPYRE